MPNAMGGHGIDKTDAMFGTAAEWNAGFKAAHPSYYLRALPVSAGICGCIRVGKKHFEAANKL